MLSGNYVFLSCLILKNW